jgi:hypothetical protein
MPHTPELQVATPLVAVGQGVQLAPHVTTDPSLTHEPAQPWNPALHVYPHEPTVHVGVAFAGAEHGVQLVPHVATAVSSAQADPHAWKPALHVKPQVPAVHVAVPLVGIVHDVVHVPQCVESVCRLAHELPQSTSNAEHPETHTAVEPAIEQIGVAPVHVVAQAPQLEAVFNGASQPLFVVPSQLPYPALQVIPQVVPSQVATPLVELQGVQSDPQ